MQRTSKRSHLVNAFGILGYLSCLAQWLWLAALFLPVLLESDAKKLFLPASGHSEAATHVQLGGPALLWTIVGAAVTVLMLGITVLVLARLPGAVAKTGHKAVESTAAAVLPIVTHHAKLPPKKRRVLTAQLIKISKLVLTLLPVLAISGLYFVSNTLSPNLALFVGSLLAIVTLIWFSLEYLCARWLKVPLESII